MRPGLVLERGGSPMYYVLHYLALAGLPLRERSEGDLKPSLAEMCDTTLARFGTTIDTLCTHPRRFVL